MYICTIIFFLYFLFTNALFTMRIHKVCTLVLFVLCCVGLDWIGLGFRSLCVVCFSRFAFLPFLHFVIFAILLSFLPVPSLARSRFFVFVFVFVFVFWIGYRLQIIRYRIVFGLHKVDSTRPGRLASTAMHSLAYQIL